MAKLNHKLDVADYYRMTFPKHGCLKMSAKATATNAALSTTLSTLHTRTEQASAPPPASTASSCVDINTASFDQLRRIIHIDVNRAQQIIDLRPFRSVADMTRIRGIAAARVADIQAQGLACVR